jgi:PilZ domain
VKTLEKKLNKQAAEPPEKRTSPRYPFSSEVEAVDLQGHNRISARLSDIAKNGCYVDTINPFAAKTKVHLTITKDNQSFKTKADVVYSQMGMGMGLFFTEPELGHINLLTKWLCELSGEPSTDYCEPQIPALQSGGDELREVSSDLVALLRRKNILDEPESRAMLKKLYK